MPRRLSSSSILRTLVIRGHGCHPILNEGARVFSLIAASIGPLTYRATSYATVLFAVPLGWLSIRPPSRRAAPTSKQGMVGATERVCPRT
jgi:hypothetical protein